MMNMLWLSGLLWVSSALAAGATHTVRIQGMHFEPARLEVRSGDTVEWINDDPVPHTVTAEHRGIESGTIAPNGRWSHTVKREGETTYICRFHPMMKAVLSIRR